jgi:TnpA family transposase
MASIERTAYPRFSQQLSDQELDTRFGPTIEEAELIRRQTSSDEERLTFLAMLKSRQELGYFPSLDEVPEQVLAFLRAALNLPASTGLIDGRSRSHTLSRQRNLIRTTLGVRRYGDGGETVITPVLRSAALTMSDPADLINLAIETLAKANVELPAFSALDRVVGHLRQEVHATLYRSITADLTPKLAAALDALLEVPPEENVSPFARFKESPGPATLHHIRQWADRLAELDAIIDPKLFLEGIAHTKIRQFAAEASRMQIGDLRDLTQPGKRHTLLLCFLFQTQAGTRDELVEMFLRRMRRIRHAAKDKLRALQEQHQSMEESLIGILGQVLDQAKDDCNDRDLGARVRRVLHAEGGVELLGAQVESVSAYHQGNYLPLLWRFHADHRSVLFRVLELIGLAPTTQDSALIDAWRYVLQHRRARRAVVPGDIDLGFLSQRWMAFVETRDESGNTVLDRRALEVCVFTHIAEALQAGDLCVPGSAAYGDYRTQLLSWEECTARLPTYCDEVEIPLSGSALVADLRQRLNELADKVDKGFPTNSELSIDADGTPHLKIQRAKPPPAELKAFREAVHARMPERHLLDVLKAVHHWVPYTRHFGPPSGSDPKLSDSVRRYLFTVFGFGCNLGASETARHAPDSINRHSLHRINAQHVDANKLEAAVADIINQYRRFELPGCWGSDKVVIADGTQMELRENNLLGERHIRYGGFGGIAYHHISSTYIALFSKFIACGVWEAVYILDALLEQDSEMEPDILHADTQGQSEPVFGLAHLLGIKLYPRMRNWNDVIFYRPEKGRAYKHIDALFTKSIDWALIETHWQDLMQVVLSIQAGKILPSTLLRKLGSHSRQNRLNRAFRELGRVVRTLFLLRYISEADFRRSIRAETTKVESHNDFRDWIGFGGPVLKSDDPVEQAKQVKYMDLVANVIMLHNVHDLTGILADMETEGWKLTRELLAGLSPYMREHIRRFGRYLLDMDDTPPPLALRTLRILAETPG